MNKNQECPLFEQCPSHTNTCKTDFLEAGCDWYIWFKNLMERKMERTYEERKQLFGNMMLQCGLSLIEIDEMNRRLDNLNYFIQPASIRHHGNYEGGLFDHSYAVAEALVDLTKKLDLKWERKFSPYVVGLFHDLCKCNFYIYNEYTQQWEYSTNSLMTGHGDLSVIMAQQFCMLNEEEIACIRWHMGAYDEKENWDVLGRAIEKYPNVLYTHTADMIASRVKGI
jgi:hypothetical protein